MNIELMKIVERAVRTLPCDKSMKLQMRNDLYTHLEQLYEEELDKDGDPSPALTRARRRFGDPATLREELLSTISWPMRLSSWLDRTLLVRSGNMTALETAAGFGLRGGIMLLAFFFVATCWVAFYWNNPIVLHMWPTFLAIGVLFGVNAFTFTISGFGAMSALRLDGHRLRVHSPGRLLAATVGAGLAFELSFIILLEVARRGTVLETSPLIFAGILAVIMLLFAAVVAMIAKIELHDRQWSALDLSEN